MIGWISESIPWWVDLIFVPLMIWSAWSISAKLGKVGDRYTELKKRGQL